MVGVVVMTTTTVGTAPPPKTDCGTATAVSGSNCRGLGIAARQGKTMDVVIANSWSKYADPWRGNHHATGAVGALYYGNGRGIAGVTMPTPTRTHERMSPMSAAIMIIACRPLPKRQRITGPSRELHNKSLDDSTEGEYRWQCCNDNGRTRQWQRQRAGIECNRLLTMTATGSGKSGWGQMMKATDNCGGQW